MKHQIEGFRVYANHLYDIRQRLLDVLGWDSYGNKLNYEPDKEWLFDLIWCIDDNEYGIKSLELVVECEWSHKRDDKDKYGHVKYDFQKLLAACAQLCVMIFKWEKNDEPDNERTHELDEYFENVISKFRPRVQNKKILCIGYSCDFDHIRYKLFDCT